LISNFTCWQNIVIKIGCPQDLCFIPFSLPMKYNLGLGVSCAWKWQMYVNEKTNEKENKQDQNKRLCVVEKNIKQIQIMLQK